MQTFPAHAHESMGETSENETLTNFQFILFLSTIATIGMVYSITLKVISKAPLRDIIIRTLDIITIVVPPALPGLKL